MRYSCEKCATESCRHKTDPREIMIRCAAFKKPMTNADRIREMTDFELAKFLCDAQRDNGGEHPCNCCVAAEYCRPGHSGMIDWLQKPVGRDDHGTE